MKKAFKTAVALLGIVLVTLICLVAYVGWWTPMLRDRNNDKVRKRVETDLPIGSTKPQVVRFLKIYHGEYSVAQGGKQIYALVRGSPPTEIFQTDLQITFDFDSTGHLRKSEIHDVYTGP